MGLYSNYLPLFLLLIFINFLFQLPRLFAGSRGKRKVRNIKQNLSQPVCPKCGKLMVLRTARKGPKVGNQFWGCSNFPYCRVIKNKKNITPGVRKRI